MYHGKLGLEGNRVRLRQQLGHADLSLSDSLSVRIVDIEMHDIAVTTNDLPQVEYDYSHVGRPAEWTLHNLDTETDVTNHAGIVFMPPADLPVGTYSVLATYPGICENGEPFSIQSALLHVGSIVFEPQTTALDPTGRHAVNPSYLGKGLTGWFAAEVSENYYQAGILQRELVVRNVMCSGRPLSRRDVARGDILGIWYTIQDNPATGQRVKVWHKSLAPVGFTSHAILPPVHY